MKSNKQFSNLYDKKNISRIKYIAKFNAREIHFSEDDKFEFNLNYIHAAYLIKGSDLIGCDVKNLPLGCTFLHENHIYEVYEFKSNFYYSQKSHEGKFYVILFDRNNHMFYSGYMIVKNHRCNFVLYSKFKSWNTFFNRVFDYKNIKTNLIKKPNRKILFDKNGFRKLAYLKKYKR